MKVSKSKAEKVLAALLDQCKPWVQEGYEPKLVQDFDDREWTILWEEGPYEWPYLFPHGGIEEEFGFKVADLSSQIPAEVFVEPINHYSVGIYEA